MQWMEKAEVDLPDDRSVRVRRSFRAPPEDVWRAFTDPALVRRWMLGPPGWEMPVCEMDVRAGGAYRWRWRNGADGSEFGFEGRFREVDAPRRLVHGETFDPGTLGGDMGGECLVETVFAPMEGGTGMTVTITYASGEDREKALATGMTDGMEMSYTNLDGELAAISAG